MKLSDMKQIEKLIRIRQQCMEALESAVDGPEALLDFKDAGGIPGFEEGFWGQYCQHSDGSGWKMDMSGCYVAEAVLNALIGILQAQVQRVDEHLLGLGVDPHA